MAQPDPDADKGINVTLTTVLAVVLLVLLLVLLWLSGTFGGVTQAPTTLSPFLGG